MSQYRRHAIVAILVLAAVITPTADIMTLIVVSLPIWLLYEISIWIVHFTNKKESLEEVQETDSDTNTAPEIIDPEAVN